MGILAGGVNLYFIYKFLRILTTKWEDTDAFKLGIIDEKGKILKKHSTLKSSDEKDAYTLMHRLVWKLKRLLNKIPGGKSKLASYAAALWLIKEEREFTGTNEELQESFLTFLESDWKNDALILKETYEGDMNKTTYTTLMTNMSEAGDKEAYQAFFKATLKKFGVTEPDQLEGDKKKKFFDAIDKGWKGDNEKPEPGDKKEEVEIDESFIDDIVDTFKSILRIPKNVALITKSILNGNVKDMESLSSNLSDKQRDKMIKMFSDQLKDGKYKKQGKINIIKLLATLKHDSLKEEVEVDESNELQAIMALDDVGIEASINKKDQVVVKKKDLKKAEDALKKSFRKGGAPELHGEEVELGEEFKEKDFDSLKKGDTITIEFKSPMSTGKSTFKVTAKNVVGKARVEKATLQNVKKPNSVKFFLYKRGNKVSLAQGDMAASVVKYTVEEVEMDEAKGTAYPATIDTLRKIVKDKQHQTVMFKSGKAIVDLFTASAMVQVYDALKKPEMKKTFEKMIGDKAGFLKTQEFAMKMISGGK